MIPNSLIKFKFFFIWKLDNIYIITQYIYFFSTNKQLRVLKEFKTSP